ncbi:hypothetical protein OBBRIDRAFT_796088 [Obba rivulosa]|uniref:Protein kinase domain-containing protein n=1 Tax=Obba rivulosa TaxID=1052685 RepID=A0A8E2DGW9_9APHY|nr:hypothetical protein OBBRIDRAFT_796088 [Obba rivulosa]
MSPRKIWESKLLGRTVSPYSGRGFSADGSIVVPSRLGDSPLLLLELENEIGSRACDPNARADFVYRKWWSSDSAAMLRKACCCPSFTMTIAGPHLTIRGAIFTDTFVAQPLTETLWLANDPDLNGRIRTIARVLCALRTCLDELDNFYQNLRSPRGDDMDLNSISPHFQSYSSGGREIRLKYTGDNIVGGQAGQALFVAETDENADDCVMVKFVRTYNPEAHSLLASLNLAPRLRHFQTFEDGLSVVVMDYLPGQCLAETPTRLPRVLADVRRAVDALHAQDLVFGDLRPPNIILCKRAKEGEARVSDEVAEEWEQGAMLVDFDWCDKHGEGRYPPSLNTYDIMWHPDVKQGGIMCKEHDEFMFKKLSGFTF